MGNVTIQVQQQSLTATQAIARTHTVMIDRPTAKGGTDSGAMGGELLLMSLGGCFMSNLLEAIRTREAAISDVNINVVGTLDGKPARFTAIEMQISGQYEDADLMKKLITISERSCIVANSIKGSVTLSFTLN